MSNPSDDTTRALEPDARRRITPTPLVPCLRHLLVGPAAVLLIIVGVEQVRLTPSFPMTVMLAPA